MFQLALGRTLEVFFQKMRLAIVVGHTDRNKGASMVPPYGFIQEYEYCTILGGIILAMCREKNILCKVFFRDKKKISKTYDLVRAYRPHATIELHFNAFISPNVKGHSVLYSVYNSASKDLARHLNEWMTGTLETRNRGIKELREQGRGFTNVSQLNTATVILEPFFGTNEKDAAEGLMSINPLAESILDGVAHFYSDLQGHHSPGIQ